jgi:hypothetical protein
MSIYNLGDYALTTAVTGSVITDSGDDAFIEPDDFHAATIQIKLAYGSGGTTLKVYVQTSLDQGSTWVDVSCSAFTTASATKIVNLSGLTPKTTAATPRRHWMAFSGIGSGSRSRAPAPMRDRPRFRCG